MIFGYTKGVGKPEVEIVLHASNAGIEFLA